MVSVKSHMREREREKQREIGKRGKEGRERRREETQKERERVHKGWWSTEQKGMKSVRDNQSRLPGKD